jgi:hypothetical protein
MELRPYEKPDKPKRGVGFFWWSVLLLLLSGACFASWVISFYVISHPEVPKCYRFLKKIKRLDSPKRFKVTEAPRGEFVTAGKLLERFGKMGPAELEYENAELLRAFIMNYRESKRPVIYVTGKYDVVDTYPLGSQDFFPSGAALVSQSIEHPQVLFEILFTATQKTVPAIREALPTGSDVTLHRSKDLFSLVHVARLKDGLMQFTAVPLPYGAWQFKNRPGGFRLDSPEELETLDPKLTINIDAGLPIVRGERLLKGLDAYAAYRRKSLANTSGDQAALNAPELVRYDPLRNPPPPPKSEVTAEPEKAPVPAPGELAKPAPPPTPAPRPIPTPAPAVPLPPRPIVRTLPPPPLITAVPKPNPSSPGTPQIPAPAVPAAEPEVVTVAQASAMVDQRPARPLLLSGEFVVTGVLGQRVALRTRESLRDSKADPKEPGTSAAMVVVDFPPGMQPPEKGSMLSRSGAETFEVRDVMRQKNGQITIVAAERPR